MDKLSDKLLEIINDQDFCFTPDEMRAVEKALHRFKAYEDTGLGPEEFDSLCAEMSDIRQMFKPSTYNEILTLIQTGAYEHLLELVQAEKDGRLVVLPFHLGDTLYKITSVFKKPIELECSGYFIKQCLAVEESKVMEITVLPSGDQNRFQLLMKNDRGAVHTFEMSDLGKTVFLTRSDAQAALKGGKHETDSV